MRTREDQARKGLGAFWAAALACALGATSARADAPAAGAGQTFQKLDAILDRMIEDREYAFKVLKAYDPADKKPREILGYWLANLKPIAMRARDPWTRRLVRELSRRYDGVGSAGKATPGALKEE